jgi:autotransporter-associated beta strand protein
MRTASLSIGAIHVDSTRSRALTIGNSSTNAGTLTLNGTTVNSISNVILRNASANLLTLQNNESGTGKTMNIALGNSTNNIISVDGTGGITIDSVIQGAGRNLTISGTNTGTVTLSGNNTFGGVLTVAEGKLTVSSVNNASQDGVLGNSANAVVLGASGQTGFLHYVGNTNASTDKTFTAATGGTAGIEASNAATTLTLSGAIGGAGNVQKGGAGTLLLAGNNTFTGALNVHDGTLEIASINNNSADGTLGNSTNPVSLGKSGTANVSALLYTGGTASTTKGFTMASDATAGVINVANSGTTLTVSGQITGTSGSGLTKTGIGRLSLSGSSSYNGATAVSAGDLNLSGGSISNSAVTVASGASLSGYGSVGTIGGAGAINPGNSPGILTTPQVDPSGGTDFNFEMTGTVPTYDNASNSVNDVIRITGGTPFSQALAGNGTNSINIYFSGDALFTESPKTITGGFFTDQSGSFASSITNATYNYYFANTNGANSYNGASYYTRNEYESLVLNTNMLITISTVAQTADFASGVVNGQIMQVQVIPEPSTYALLGLSAAAFGAYRWRRRRRG